MTPHRRTNFCTKKATSEKFQWISNSKPQKRTSSVISPSILIQLWNISNWTNLVFETGLSKNISIFIKQIVLVVFLDYFVVNLSLSLQYFFSYTCWWQLLNTSSMISYLIFLNLSFMHLELDSPSKWIHPMDLFVIIG